jgi:hypothetical protein
MNKHQDKRMQTQLTISERGTTVRPLFLMVALVVAALGTGGCAPKVWAANAIQPSQPGDTKEVWIYLHTDDDAVDGVYRCYDGEQKPVCKRATLITK